MTDFVAREFIPGKKKIYLKSESYAEQSGNTLDNREAISAVGDARSTI